ncbi:short-chain dehydrogenase/reductase SDR [Kipferlia bialata]|uniref:Short-chain dehydrogenase/reductase SDR n=1 Tax=Kipferlia bialata TaxID=797122 RepID=A0A9K3D4T1_9EUKA|nr:short-chain dehydrogenase/reductase SDR [Kipferlia bialata]|eukprot:g10898.t1
MWLVYCLLFCVSLYLPGLVLPRLRPYSLKGKHVLVTGGANGIGAKMAEIALSKGATVTSLDFREAETPIPGVTQFQCDINNDKRVDEIIAQIEPVDVCIHNAGIVSGATVSEFTRSTVHRTIETNLTSPIVMAAKLVQQGKVGDNVHVFTSSASALCPPPRTVEYGASKAGIANAATALRAEFGYLGMKGCSIGILPYYIRTPLFEGVESWFIPIMEPETVARRVMAIVQAQGNLSGGNYSIPWYLQYLVGVTAFLPRWLETRLIHFLGITRSMAEWTGRGKESHSHSL